MVSDFIGPPMAPAASPGASWSSMGMALGIAGALGSAVGTFFEVKTQQYQARSAALSAEFEATLSAHDARNAELDAQSILQAGQEEIGRLTMAAGAERASRRASMAASGIELGAGSAVEVQASADLITAIDRFTISRNALRAAAAQRMQGVNASNRSLLASVSAQNLRASARSMNPWLAAGTSLLTSGARSATNWVIAQDNRYGGRGTA